MFCAVAFLANATSLSAATLTVTSIANSGGTCPGADCSLRQAIATAAAGDTINFQLPAPSTITLTTSGLQFNKRLQITGPGANLLTIQRSAASGTQTFRVFTIFATEPVAISGVTIANGNIFDVGGGIKMNNGGELTLDRVMLTGNSANAGGAIWNTSGKLTILNSSIANNSARGVGGGIAHTRDANHPFASALVIDHSTISGNTANTGASGSADAGGIWIFASGPAGTSMPTTITNCTIAGNGAAGVAGGVWSNSGTVNFGNTIVAGNVAAAGSPDLTGSFQSSGFNLIGNNSGAAIPPAAGDQIGTAASPIDPGLEPLMDNRGPTLTRALLVGSRAFDKGRYVGAATDQRGLPRPVDDPTTANAAGGDGSDIGAYEAQPDELPGCSGINRVVNNNNDGGTGSLRFVIANVCTGSTITFAPNVTGTIDLTSGELLINKSLTINGPGANLLAIRRSSAGGTPTFRILNIASADVTAALSGLTIASGNTSGNGGGVANVGTLTITDSSISANVSGGGGSGGGGGIHNTGTLSVARSTISGNQASGYGGGIRNAGTLNLTNSTISGNSATLTGGGGIFYGGGIFTNGSMVTITNTTISGNTASYRGGGMTIFAGTVRARSAIIAQNTAGNSENDLGGALTSEGFNLIGNSTGAIITPAQVSDQIGSDASPIDPFLGPLQDNGGPTFTRALLAPSSAINKGHASGLSTDQRGFIRPAGNPTVSGGDGGDIGALEVPAPAATPTPTPAPTATPTPQPTATPTPTPQNILSDGGFEQSSPSFSAAWTLTPPAGPNPGQQFSRVGSNPAFARSGNNYAELAPDVGQTGALSQTLNTVTGETYTLSFYLANDSIQPVNFFQVIVNGSTLFNTSSPPFPINSRYVMTSASFVATASSTTLEFRYRHDASFWRLDDVSVAGPVPATPTPTATPIATPTPSPTVTPRETRTVLANISTRLRVENGDNALIGGFIVTGSEAKRLIVRAIGASIPLPTALSDPQLEIYNAAGELIAFNDNWEEALNAQEIFETTIPPSHPLESAVLDSVNPGAYTAVVSGVNGATGIGLVEAYDLDRAAASKLANISTRGLVQTGDDAMIGGLIVLGERPQRVIIRAIGPSLPIDGRLEDPSLELYDANGVLLQSNDNWRSDQESEIQETTIPPTNELEAAIVRILPPAPHTAIVRGVNDGTGVALVEVYALD